MTSTRSTAGLHTQRFELELLEPDVLDELLEDIREHYQHSEAALLALDKTPQDVELVRSLFRSVHTIKGNVGIVGFHPAIPLLASAEDLLGFLREGVLAYSAELSDLVLVILDSVESMLEAFAEQGFVDFQPQQAQQLAAILSPVMSRPQNDHTQTFAAAIRCLDPAVNEGSELNSSLESAIGSTAAVDGEAEQDLQFFRQLIEPVEARSQYWQGRSERILRLVLILNRLAGRPVNEQDLAVAVYVHDFGMAFIPVELLHKQTQLDDAEILLLRSHVQSSAQLLQQLPRWQAAREIVLQHHEAVDGSGYPFGLREREISDGAKMLAIADSFDAMTHHRAYASHQKRPIIRAVKEINQCAGKQLSPYWVEVFNRAVAPVLAARKQRGSSH
jgi:HD-GYP domain-containing protein (c-di-GMP phosphodiesterase class II)